MSYWDKEKSLAMGEPYELHAFYLYDVEYPWYPVLRTTTAQTDPGLTHTTPISNLTELQAMTATGNYYLTNNIDASASVSLDGGSGFTPIGTIGTPFTGTFDGCGYTITDLFIDRTTSDIGLFGVVKPAAKIANVTLADCDITGDNDVGALIGSIDSDTTDKVLIQNCHSSGGIYASSGDNVLYHGGLIGKAWADDMTKRCEIYDCSSSCTVDSSAANQSHGDGGLIGDINYSIVYNCFATGNITGEATSVYVGGLIGGIGGVQGGNDESEVSYCYATGNVAGEDNVGGFAGEIELTGGYVRRCYSTGNVTSSDAVSNSNHGGFTGSHADGDIIDCYAWGNVTQTGGSSTGGFIGNGLTGATVTNCYCIGEVSGSLNVGGFSGNSFLTATSCYWNTDTANQPTSVDGEGKTTLEMWTPDTYVDWDFEDIWQMSDLIVNEEAWFYADAPIDIEYAGQTFLAGYITGGKIEMGITGMKARTLVKTDWHNAFVWQYTTTPPSAKIMYKRFRGHGEDVQLIFRGEVLGVEFKQSSRQGNRFAEITCEPPRSKTGELGLIARYSRQCSVDLYSTQCGVTKADYQTTGTLDSYSANVLTSTTFGGQADGYWEGGEIIIGRRRAKIIEHSGNNITILPFLYDINAGDSFSIYPGCDHLETTCTSKFSNLANYKGQPEIPIENPFGEIFGDSGFMHPRMSRAIQ